MHVAINVPAIDAALINLESDSEKMRLDFRGCMSPPFLLGFVVTTNCQ